MKPETLNKVLTLISNANEKELRVIYDTANYRAKQLRDIEAATQAAKVEEGAMIRTKNIKPKYMNGRTGEVIGFNDGRVRVRITNMSEQGQRRFGNPILLTYGQLEVVE